MAEFKIGMSGKEFFKENAEKLKSLPKEQRQKIANFWNSDYDGKITNTIELAILEGFTSESGKVVMPKGKQCIWSDETNRGCAMRTYDDYGRFRFTEEENEKGIVSNVYNWGDGYRDDLYDDDGDGIADRRSIRITYSNFNNGDIGGDDNNLDGRLIARDIQKDIEEMLSEDNNP